MTKKMTIFTMMLVITGIVVSIGVVASTQPGMIKKRVKTLLPEKSQDQSATGSEEVIIGSQGSTVTASSGAVFVGAQGRTVAKGTTIGLDTTPVGELTRFENNLIMIRSGLAGGTATVAPHTSRTLQSDWNNMIAKHKSMNAGVIIHPSGTTTPDTPYIQTKQRVEQTLKTTLNAINKKITK